MGDTFLSTNRNLKLTPLALLVAALSACSPAPENPADNRVEAPTETIANQSESKRLEAFFARTFEEKK